MNGLVNIIFTAIIVLVVLGWGMLLGFKTMSKLVVQNMKIGARLQKLELIDALMESGNYELQRAAVYLNNHIDDE
ncbi:hypothetical protein [Weissella viridescens]|uniref:hypothetical protein n=1 Tax=Weissella viridescens TaxID=1629 RepID=UPI003AA8ECA1